MLFILHLKIEHEGIFTARSVKLMDEDYMLQPYDLKQSVSVLLSRFLNFKHGLVRKKLDWYTCIEFNRWLGMLYIRWPRINQVHFILEAWIKLCVSLWINSKKLADEEAPRRKTQYSAQSGRIIPASSWGGKKRSSRTSHKRAQRWQTQSLEGVELKVTQLWLFADLCILNTCMAQFDERELQYLLHCI